MAIVVPTPNYPVGETIMVLGDSQLPCANDTDGTQLPCSPSQLLQTDAAIKTLAKTNEVESGLLEEKVVSPTEVKTLKSKFICSV